MSFTDKFFTLKSTCHLEGPQAGDKKSSSAGKVTKSAVKARKK